MKKLVFCLSIFLFVGCQNIFIYSPKVNHVCGEGNTVKNEGSDLKDAKASQSNEGNDPKFEIPLPISDK